MQSTFEIGGMLCLLGPWMLYSRGLVLPSKKV